MVTSIVFVALIGILQFNSAISAAINYEPIKITVNENFNAQSGEVSLQLQEPRVLHQGANFYFKPQLNLPSSYIPSHIEGLISLIQKHSCSKDASKVVVEKDKLIEVLKPFLHPVSEISKDTLSEIVLEKENDELKTVTPELLVIPEVPTLVLPSLSFNGTPPIVEEEVKKEKSIILEEPTGLYPTIPEIAVRPITEPIVNYVEPKPINAELVAIPEASVLPPLSANDIHVVEEVNVEEPIVVDVELKNITSKLLLIPEAPVLPPLSFNDLPPIVEKEVEKEESIILEAPTGVFPTIPETAVRTITEPIINYVEPKPINAELVVIPEAPVLPPLSANDIHVVEEVNVEEPIVIDVEPKPAIQELVAIPKAPVLPSLSLHDISSMIEEGKKEKLVIFEEPTRVFPTIPEIHVRPIEEPIINYVEPKNITSKLLVIPEAPVLPPLPFNSLPPIVEKEESIILEAPTGVFPTIPEIAVRPITEPIINYVEPKNITSKLLVIPEAPVLPPLSFNGIPPNVEEEVKKEESIILEAPTGVFPTIPETAVRTITEPIINYVEPKPINAELVVIPEAPVLPPLSANDIHVVEEVNVEEPIVVDIEPKPAIQELVAIPEAPVLPSLSLHDISSMIEEGRKEELLIFEEPTRVFPTIPEIHVRPIEEPIINYVEPKNITSKLLVIPEAPVLPPLSFNGLPPIVEEEVEKEESIILELPTGVFPTIPKITVRPITESVINYVEPKPINAELVVIPEAPVLPPLSANDIHVDEEVKIEEPIVFDLEPKPVIQKLVAIPEAPVLPSLSLHDISSMIEEGKREELVIFEKPTRVFPTIPEMHLRPIEEPIINYVEPKNITSELLVIPEAPVLPPLSFNGITRNLEEELEKEESTIFEAPTGVFPTIPETSETVESFALENNIFPIATEEVKIEVPILFEESIEVFPPTVEIASGPTLQESEMTDSYVLEEDCQPNPESIVTFKETLPPTIIPKPSNFMGVFSYAPFVSHLSNRAPKTKKLMIPKPASVERFLLKKHPFSLPVTPFPKPDLNAIKSSRCGNKKQFLHPTSYAHDVVEKRIAPNMPFKNHNAPKRTKIYIRSNVPKGPSYL